MSGPSRDGLTGRRGIRDHGEGVKTLSVRRYRITFLLLVACCLVAGYVVGDAATGSASPAQERPCNAPYGCPPTSPPPGPVLACPGLDPRQGPPGTQVTATVTGVDPPGATVTILFDASPVASGEASGGTAQITFTVPASAEPRAHSVTAVAPNGSAKCGPGASGFTVTAAAGENRGDGAGNGPSGRSGAGGLARTGITIGALLAAALLLIIVGRVLVEESRRRRSAS